MSAVATTGVIEGKRRTYAAGVAAMQRGTFVMQGADDFHVIPATAGAQTIGVVEESIISANDVISVVYEGEAYMTVGAAVVAPAYLISDASGRAIPTSAAGDQVGARAVSSGAVANDEIVVYINPFIR